MAREPTPSTVASEVRQKFVEQTYEIPTWRHGGVVTFDLSKFDNPEGMVRHIREIGNALVPAAFEFEVYRRVSKAPNGGLYTNEIRMEIEE